MLPAVLRFIFARGHAKMRSKIMVVRHRDKQTSEQPAYLAKSKGSTYQEEKARTLAKLKMKVQPLPVQKARSANCLTELTQKSSRFTG